MSSANASRGALTAEIFSAVLRPHRSLSPRGFAWLMSGLAVVSAAMGLTFFAIGAWPVPGFLGLDVLAVYLAFRLSFRHSRAAEEISISRDRLTVRRVDAKGRASITDLNPYWARLEIDCRPPLGITRLAITSHGRSFAIGSFLGPSERATLASALSAALAQARSASSS